MTDRIGFDREIRLEWLDNIASLIPLNLNIKALKQEMSDYLMQFNLKNDANRKTYQVLKRIWYGVSTEHIALRDEATYLFIQAKTEERLWLHWGMSLLAYPFFKDVVEIIGILFTLQNYITNNQITQRLEEKWGSRTTIKKALPRVLKSLMWWNVIEKDKKSRYFKSTEKKSITNSSIVNWFIVAIIHSYATQALPIKKIPQLPICFPFIIDLDINKLKTSNSLNFYTEGIGLEMVSLV